MVEKPEASQATNVAPASAPVARRNGVAAQIFGQFWTAAFWRDFVAKIAQTLVEAAMIAFGEGIIEYVRAKRGVSGSKGGSSVASTAFGGGSTPPSYGNFPASPSSFGGNDRSAFGFMR